MMSFPKVVTRPMKPCEFHHAQEWAVNEGWNPGPTDCIVFHSADPGSLIAADLAGQPVGVVSSVHMTPEFGFLGFFVLSPAYRRSTFGWHLMQASLERAGKRVVGGEGMLCHLRSYARFGLHPRYLTISHHGTAPDQPSSWPPGVEPAFNTPLAEISAYDAINFGVPRTPFLREWLALPGSLSVVFKQAGRICGMGTARRCHHGVRIGPLQADDAETAEALFDALVGFAPGELISIDVPETNPEAGKLMRKKNLTPGTTTARLYRGEPPVGLQHRVYGQMSFALG